MNDGRRLRKKREWNTCLLTDMKVRKNHVVPRFLVQGMGEWGF
jgi:hypothetical protein